MFLCPGSQFLVQVLGRIGKGSEDNQLMVAFIDRGFHFSLDELFSSASLQSCWTPTRAAFPPMQKGRRCLARDRKSNAAYLHLPGVLPQCLFEWYPPNLHLPRLHNILSEVVIQNAVPACQADRGMF